MRTKALTALCLTFISAHVFSATQAETDALYKEAIAAIDRNDCATGAVLLRKYKVDAAEYLNAKPVFSAAIDKQIAKCETVVASRTQAQSHFHGKGKVQPDPAGFKGIADKVKGAATK
jgi:hypothetical protein